MRQPGRTSDRRSFIEDLGTEAFNNWDSIESHRTSKSQQGQANSGFFSAECIDAANQTLHSTASNLKYLEIVTMPASFLLTNTISTPLQCLLRTL